MEPQVQGYPVIIYYLTAFIGVVLIFYRPRWAFLFIVFCLGVRNYHLANFTRPPLLGYFLNLNDLFLWIGLLAAVRIGWQGQKIWVPKILLAIFGVVLVGSIQVLFLYGFSYQIMQSIWGILIFPIMFYISVNMVRSTQDARLFYWVLFLGALGAAFQHVFLVSAEIANILSEISYQQLRTISFLSSGGIFLVISAFFVDMRKICQKRYFFIFWAIGISLISMSYLLSFTRTVWVGAVMAGVALCLILYREWREILSRFSYVLTLLVIIIMVFQVTNFFLLSEFNLAHSLDKRIDFIRYEDTFNEAYESRETGMETELDLWLDGTIIWGVGSSYPPSFSNASILEAGALNHVAISSYLAHYGLIGLVIFGFLLPFLTIRIGRRYYFHHKHDFGGVIALIGMTMAFFDLATLLSSNHHLGATSHIPGLIYGSLWGLSRSYVVYVTRTSAG